jgi:hypothetical protein
LSRLLVFFASIILYRPKSTAPKPPIHFISCPIFTWVWGSISNILAASVTNIVKLYEVWKTEDLSLTELPISYQHCANAQNLNQGCLVDCQLFLRFDGVFISMKSIRGQFNTSGVPIFIGIGVLWLEVLLKVIKKYQCWQLKNMGVSYP